MKEILPEVEAWREAGERVVVATVVATRRSAPRPVGTSLAVFVTLYVLLLVLDVWLMRRYARLDPPEHPGVEGDVGPVPAIG